MAIFDNSSLPFKNIGGGAPPLASLEAPNWKRVACGSGKQPSGSRRGGVRPLGRPIPPRACPFTEIGLTVLHVNRHLECDAFAAFRNSRHLDVTLTGGSVVRRLNRNGHFVLTGGNHRLGWSDGHSLGRAKLDFD